MIAGDTVSVLGEDGVEVARGIVAYSDVDSLRILGRKSSDIEGILGFRGRDEIIHRDDLVIMGHESVEIRGGVPNERTAASPS